MNWKDLKVEIEKADKQINIDKDNYSAFYRRKRMFWSGYKRGIGMAYKIFKATCKTRDESERLIAFIKWQEENKYKINHKNRTQTVNCFLKQLNEPNCT